VALLSTVAAGRTTSLLGAHESTALALTAGYRLAFTVGAAMSGAALVLAAALLRRPRAAAVRPHAAGIRPSATAVRPRAAAINETGPAQRIPQASACAATGQTAAPTNCD
jgi:Flp pilus assembly protein protease CpaA